MLSRMSLSELMRASELKWSRCVLYTLRRAAPGAFASSTQCVQTRGTSSNHARLPGRSGALDSQTGVQILKLLSDFNHRYKKTVVVITHNQKIAQIADRVFFFKDGELEKIEVNETPRKPEEVDW